MSKVIDAHKYNIIDTFLRTTVHNVKPLGAPGGFCIADVPWLWTTGSSIVAPTGSATTGKLTFNQGALDVDFLAINPGIESKRFAFNWGVSAGTVSLHQMSIYSDLAANGLGTLLSVLFRRTDTLVQLKIKNFINGVESLATVPSDFTTGTQITVPTFASTPVLPVLITVTGTVIRLNCYGQFKEIDFASTNFPKTNFGITFNSRTLTQTIQNLLVS